MTAAEWFIVGDFDFRTLRGDVDTVRLVSCQECGAIMAVDDVRRHRDSIHPDRPSARDSVTPTERDTLEVFLVGIDTTHAELWDSIAAAIVESDWLAAHDARVAAEARRDTLERAAAALVFHGRVTLGDLPRRPTRTEVARWLRAFGEVA